MSRSHALKQFQRTFIVLKTLFAIFLHSVCKLVQVLLIVFLCVERDIKLSYSYTCLLGIPLLP